MKSFLIVVAVLTAFICTQALAQEVTKVTSSTETKTEVKPEEKKQRISVAAGYWYTWSKLNRYVYAPPSSEDAFTGILYNQGDKVSELEYDLDAGMAIVNADLWIWWRFYADGFLGWGSFDGSQEDSDWLTLINSQKWSLSKSDADGDVRTWNANAYLRVIEEPDDKGYLDLGGGYFYYRDDVEHLKNSTQVISNWTVVNTPIAGHDSQDRYTFDGFRFAARALIRVHKRLAIKFNGGFCPWGNVKDKGYWNLREMNIDAEANATMFDLDIGLEFNFTKNLSIEAGYKYIDLDSDRGNDTRTWSDGTKITYTDAFKAEGHRGGFYGMARLSF